MGDYTATMNRSFNKVFCSDSISSLRKTLPIKKNYNMPGN